MKHTILQVVKILPLILAMSFPSCKKDPFGLG